MRPDIEGKPPSSLGDSGINDLSSSSDQTCYSPPRKQPHDNNTATLCDGSSESETSPRSSLNKKKKRLKTSKPKTDKSDDKSTKNTGSSPNREATSASSNTPSATSQQSSFDGTRPKDRSYRTSNTNESKDAAHNPDSDSVNAEVASGSVEDDMGDMDVVEDQIKSQDMSKDFQDSGLYSCSASSAKTVVYNQQIFQQQVFNVASLHAVGPAGDANTSLYERDRIPELIICALLPLDREDNGSDWRMLACRLQLDRYIESIQTRATANKCSAIRLLMDKWSQITDKTITDRIQLIKQVLESMQRIDVLDEVKEAEDKVKQQTEDSAQTSV